jgi:hypothetical protein
MASSISNDWLCAITLGVMRDPVIAADGHTYERSAIEQWFVSNVSSPKTGLPLHSTNLISNIALRNTIQEFFAKNPHHLGGSQRPAYVQSEVTLAPHIYTARGSKYLHMKVAANGIATRKPIELIAIVDNSGSMGEVADAEATESFGYTRMDLVKHTLRTLAAVLQETDTLSIVTYSTQARVVLTPTPMDTVGKAKISAALDTIHPDSQTNIYDGIRQAAGIANSPELAGKNIVALLLTDGFPNVNPPRGIVPTLKMMEMKNRWTLSTFGFGYKLDSALLSELAIWGGGLFGFIPDCSMVATIFINFIANVLSTATTNATITYDGIVIETGPIMYGQSRDFVIPLTGSTVPVCTLNGAAVPTLLEGSDDTEFVDSRQIFMSAMRDTLVMMSHDNNVAGATALLKSASDTMKVEGFIKDICGDDPEGQIGIAPKYYAKWGEHYMRSYLRAQNLQQCMNFKDPGLQVYGGELFRSIQKVGDKAFDDLPPPIPSAQPAKTSVYALPYSPRSLTQSFNNPSGGCFHGDCKVLMADFTRTAIKDIVPGSIVWTPSGPSRVVALVTCNTKNKSQPMSQIDGLSITPWHPIRNKHGVWEYPASLYFYTERMLQTVYNLVLETGHIVNVEGFDCITLGHGFTEPVAAHPYFGSQRVIDDLKKLAGWAEGRPTFTNLVAVKDAGTNMICEWVDVV